jgi:ADP-heptose:LPS heptosyltransferase
MKKSKGLDSWLERLKRLERRYYLADYEDERLRQQWLEKPAAAPFEERVFPVTPDLASLREILIFKPDDIGDAVQALPAIAEIRRALPQARLSLLCQEMTAGIFERAGLFNEIIPVKVKIRGRRFPVMPLEEALAKFSAKEFDLAVYLRTYPAFFSYFLKIPARYRVHPADPRLPSDSVYRMPVSQWGERRVHASLQLLEIAAMITRRSYTFEDVSYPPLAWNDSDREALTKVFPEGVPNSFIVIHPFAKDETRRYPEEYWTVVIGALQKKFNVPIVLTGGSEDSRLDVEGVIQAQGSLNIVQTAYLISQGAAFIGNISGPAHLASAVGKPTITIMGGNSLPAEWAPLGKSLILRANVPCAPCYQRTCPVYGLACLKELGPERILPEVESFLSRHVFPSTGLPT